MYNAMMDPDLMRIAQEQMSRMSPSDFARIQQQMMSNPDLMRMATESMQNMRPEDIKFAAEQLKQTHPEQMAQIGEKMAKASPEEIASMQARLDAQVSYEISSAGMLKKQGNELHNQGRYTSALEKYIRAKQILKDVPSPRGQDLILACSLNMMSCYLKTKQFTECINEGTEVLAYERRNLKALYRRGQAYKELGKLEDAVSDLAKALEVSPGDETIAAVLRDAEEKLTKEGGVRPSEGLIMEEIIDEATTSNDQQDTRVVHTQMANQENSNQSVNVKDSRPTTNGEYLESLKDYPESIRSFQDFISCTDPETLSAMGRGNGEGLSPDMIKYASTAIGKMSPEEFRRMAELAAKFHGDGSPSFTHGSTRPNLSPEMFKAASDVMTKMPPEDLENMLKMAPSLHGNKLTSSASSGGAGNQGSVATNVTPDMIKMANEMMQKMSPEERKKMFEMASSLRGQGTTESDAVLFSDVLTSDSSSSTVGNLEANGYSVGEESSSRGSSSRNPHQVDFPSSSVDLQEQMRKQMKDPAMRQMLTSMVKNMSPETMANMSEQFGFKLSREEAEKAQQAMSSLSPEALDTMMRWADRIQRGVEGARKTKNWLLGKPGMILAIAMLLLAVVLHWFGFIGK